MELQFRRRQQYRNTEYVYSSVKNVLPMSKNAFPWEFSARFIICALVYFCYCLVFQL